MQEASEKSPALLQLRFQPVLLWGRGWRKPQIFCPSLQTFGSWVPLSTIFFIFFCCTIKFHHCRFLVFLDPFNCFYIYTLIAGKQYLHLLYFQIIYVEVRLSMIFFVYLYIIYNTYIYTYNIYIYKYIYI